MSAVALLLFSTVVHFSPLHCENEGTDHFWEELAKKRINHLAETFPFDVPPKNVILFIGDGMGLSAVATARIYKSEKTGQPYSEIPFFFEEFLTTGLVKTSSLNKHVTDSAAAAVAMYSGRKVTQETLGLRPGYKDDCSAGDEARINDGIAELALKKNMSVGFVTTDRITGATPAALYAKTIRRYMESDADVEKNNASLCKNRDIALQLLDYPASDFKVIMGGGRKKLKGERKDGKDIMEDWQRLSGERRVVRTPLELEQLDMEGVFNLLGVFTENIFPFFLDEGKETTAPRLIDMTERALQALQKNNENGFFLMVEGGLIDTAEHRNKMRLASEEILEFDEAVKKAREMTDASDTLILVTADHSHAMALPGELDKTSSVFGNGHVWSQRENDTLKVPGIFFVTGPGADKPINFDPKESHDPHFVSPAAIFARYGNHGAEDVGLWADGPSSRFFSGTMDNTVVAHTLRYIMCLNNKETMCDINTKTWDNNGCGSLILPIVVAVVSCLVAVGSIILLIISLRRLRGKRAVDIAF